MNVEISEAVGAKCTDELEPQKTEALRMWKEFQRQKGEEGASLFSVSLYTVVIIASVMGVTKMSIELASTDHEFLLIFLALIMVLLVCASAIGVLLDRQARHLYFKEFARNYPELAHFIDSQTGKK